MRLGFPKSFLTIFPNNNDWHAYRRRRKRVGIISAVIVFLFTSNRGQMLGVRVIRKLRRIRRTRTKHVEQRWSMGSKWIWTGEFFFTWTRVDMVMRPVFTLRDRGDLDPHAPSHMNQQRVIRMSDSSVNVDINRYNSPIPPLVSISTISWAPTDPDLSNLHYIPWRKLAMKLVYSRELQSL
jgi:hypothetical protein